MSLKDLQVLRSPLVTERTTIMREKNNQYVFRVSPDANKGQVKQAVEKFFKVKVANVRTMNYDGKLRRLAAGRPEGRKISWKKAIVTLKQGQKINLEQELA